MQRTEGGHARDKPARRERDRRRDGHLGTAPPPGDPLHRIREAIEPVAQHRVEPRSRIRQHDLAGAPLEQRQSETLLKRTDLVADRGRRDGQLLRGPLEAAVPSGAFERAKGRQRRKPPRHE